MRLVTPDQGMHVFEIERGGQSASTGQTNASFGSYSLGQDSFSYKFDGRAVFTQTPDHITVSRAIPWEGMRQFTLKYADNAVRLQYGSEAEFDFNPGGLTYSENGKVLRVYHRVNTQ